MAEPSRIASRFREWAAAAPGAPAWTFATADGDDRWTRRAMADAAEDVARSLHAAGAVAGEPVLLTWPTTPSFVAGFWGCQLAGTPVVPVPIERHIRRRERSQERLDAILRAHHMRWALAPDDHREVLAERADQVTIVDVQAGRPPVDERSEATEHGPALIQFTSGTTLSPRGCVIGGAELVQNAWAIGSACGLVGSGPVTGVNWCPLFHDMGLMTGVVLPVVARDLHAVLMAPERFATRPSRWLELLDRYDAVITVAPNAALALISRWAERTSSEFDLSQLRAVVTGAEPIDPDVVRRFTQALSRWGLPDQAVKPAYGLAEATLAVTYAAEGLRTRLVDRVALEGDGRAVAAGPGAATCEIVSVGRPVPSTSLRIVGAAGVADDGKVGEVQLRSSSLCAGYLGDEAASAALWDDGWLRTGDLGLLEGGELYVIGRSKDTIVVAGRNLAPQDVERVVSGVAGVRWAAVVAFGGRGRDRGTESVVLVVEGPMRDADRVVEELRSTVLARLGVSLADVAVVGRGVIPRTTSGKVQRQLCREQYERGDLGLSEG